LRDGGISPAETAVRVWKLLPRPNICEAATSPSRRALAIFGAVRIEPKQTQNKKVFSPL